MMVMMAMLPTKTWAWRPPMGRAWRSPVNEWLLSRAWKTILCDQHNYDCQSIIIIIVILIIIKLCRARFSHHQPHLFLFLFFNSIKMIFIVPTSPALQAAKSQVLRESDSSAWVINNNQQSIIILIIINYSPERVQFLSLRIINNLNLSISISASFIMVPKSLQFDHQCRGNKLSLR